MAGHIRESRYKRQQGLVNQRQLDDLVVVVTGSGGPLSYLLANLALLGIGRRHGGILLRSGRKQVEEEDIRGQFLLTREDVGEDFDHALIERIEEINPEVKVYPVGETTPAHAARLNVPDNRTAGDGPGPGGRVTLCGQVSRTSIYVGSSPVAVPAFEPNVLTPSLNCLCAAVLAQEALRRTQCLRRIVVAKTWVSPCYLLRAPGIGKALHDNPTQPPVSGLRFTAATGEPLRLFYELVRRPPDGHYQPDEVIVRVRLPDEDGAAQPISAYVEPFETLGPPPEDGPIVWSPFSGGPGGGAKIEDGRLVGESSFNCREVAGKKVFVAGVGALGSWLTVLFNISNTSGCRLTVVDMDAEVERHNLNRQILFDEDDIGASKADAAERRLRALNPTNEVHAACTPIQHEIIEAANAGHTESYDEFLEKPRFTEMDLTGTGRMERIMRNLHPFLAGEILSSDAVATCLDNLASRYWLNVVCENARIPLINGASQDFQGRAHRVDPRKKDPCLVCRLGEKVKTSTETARCTEEGDVPIQSIVTLSALVGAIQTIMLMLSLTGEDSESLNWFAYDGGRNSLTGVRSKPRWPDECPAHLFAEPGASPGEVEARSAGADRGGASGSA